MNVLVLGGTQFMGVHLVRRLLSRGHSVTIGTRGRRTDPFGDAVTRLTLDRADAPSLRAALDGRRFDVVCDNLAFCSNDVRNLLDVVQTERYVMTSTASVYELEATDTTEDAFDPFTCPLHWCGRDVDYGEGKRQAECALFQAYPHLSAAAVRFPLITGPDDYTGRLEFYVNHIAHGIPMSVDNLDAEMGFVNACDAGNFLAWLAENTLTGPFNGGSAPGISIGEIIRASEEFCGKKALLSPDGVSASFSGWPSFGISAQKAAAAGFDFPPLGNWMYDLLRHYASKNVL